MKRTYLTLLTVALVNTVGLLSNPPAIAQSRYCNYPGPIPASETTRELELPQFDITLTFAFFMAFLGNAIHLEAILGAFAAGLVLDETDERNELDAQVKPIADVLVPIFFVTVGARADISVLNI